MNESNKSTDPTTWYREQAEYYGELAGYEMEDSPEWVTIMLGMEPDDIEAMELAAYHYARLAAHFGRLALGINKKRWPELFLQGRDTGDEA